jgi:hypothetical protein
MSPDARLLKKLVERLSDYRETVPVYEIADRRLEEMEEATLSAGQRFVATAGLDEMRYDLRRGRKRTLILFQEGIRASVFHASGAISLSQGLHPMEDVITTEADDADERMLRRWTDEATKKLELGPVSRAEPLRFERLWRLKAAGMKEDGERGPVALTRVVGAYRRFIGRLPVWGRASVFVELAAEGRVAAAGVDWRPIAPKPFERTKVLPPNEAGARVLAELQKFAQGRRPSGKDYEPVMFSLGYFSLPKRRHQAIMQPVFVAMFEPTGPIPSLGRMIVVPAAPNAYEPIARPIAAPPLLDKEKISAGR